MAPEKPQSTESAQSKFDIGPTNALAITNYVEGKKTLGGRFDIKGDSVEAKAKRLVAVHADHRSKYTENKDVIAKAKEFLKEDFKNAVKQIMAISHARRKTILTKTAIAKTLPEPANIKEDTYMIISDKGQGPSNLPGFTTNIHRRAEGRLLEDGRIFKIGEEEYVKAQTKDHIGYIPVTAFDKTPIEAPLTKEEEKSNQAAKNPETKPETAEKPAPKVAEINYGPDIKKVDKENFRDEVLRSDKPVLVEFYADWCGPCRDSAPLLSKFATENKDQYKVVKVNGDQNSALMKMYKVTGYPTAVIFKNGLPDGAFNPGKLSNPKSLKEYLDKASYKNDQPTDQAQTIEKPKTKPKQKQKPAQADSPETAPETKKALQALQFENIASLDLNQVDNLFASLKGKASPETVAEAILPKKLAITNALISSDKYRLKLRKKIQKDNNKNDAYPIYQKKWQEIIDAVPKTAKHRFKHLKVWAAYLKHFTPENIDKDARHFVFKNPAEVGIPKGDLHETHQGAVDVFYRKQYVTKEGLREIGPMITAMEGGLVLAAASDWQFKPHDELMEKGDPRLKSDYLGGGYSNPGSGNGLVLLTFSGEIHHYVHMDNVQVKTGQIIKAGQDLGRGGNTGVSARNRANRGNHLHFEIKTIDNNSINLMDHHQVRTRLQQTASQ